MLNRKILKIRKDLDRLDNSLLKIIKKRSKLVDLASVAFASFIAVSAFIFPFWGTPAHRRAPPAGVAAGDL